MTASDVVFDTSAWLHVLYSTTRGKRLSKRFLKNENLQIHTSAITLGEIAAKLSGEDRTQEIPRVVDAIRGRSRLHDVSYEDALRGGHLRTELRRDTGEDASLADGIILGLALRLKAMLISDDPAFARHTKPERRQ